MSRLLSPTVNKKNVADDINFEVEAPLMLVNSGFLNDI